MTTIATPAKIIGSDDVRMLLSVDDLAILGIYGAKPSEEYTLFIASDHSVKASLRPNGKPIQVEPSSELYTLTRSVKDAKKSHILLQVIPDEEWWDR